MYLFCNSRIHVITLYSGHVCVYYASMLRCSHLIWILVRTDHPCLGVGCHRSPSSGRVTAPTVLISGVHIGAMVKACLRTDQAVAASTIVDAHNLSTDCRKLCVHGLPQPSGTSEGWTLTSVWEPVISTVATAPPRLGSPPMWECLHKEAWG
jgi:hypothetical protein